MTTNPPTPPARWFRSFLHIWLPAALITTVGIVLCCSIWGKTGDIIGDFGHDRYIAWQVSNGKLLFRDVACIFGPLSPEINALIIRLAGPQFNVVLAANLVVLSLTTALLYWLLRVISGTLVALTATIFFLFVFALSSPTRITNFNFLTPYSSQITHGFLLILTAIACLYRFQRHRTTAAVVFGGLATGFAFLTKPEIFLGCATSFFLGLAAIFWLDRNQPLARILISAFAGMVLPPTGFLIFYALHMPFHIALAGILGGWQFIGEPFVVSTPFYKGDLGTDHPLQNLFLMFQYAGFYMLTAAVMASFAVFANRLLKQNRWATLAAGILLGAASFFFITEIGNHFDSFWRDAARGFPVFAAFAIVLSAGRIAKSRGDAHDRAEAILQWTLSILSFVLLAKIFLNARMYHYGFVLCVPCTMMLIVALFHWLPDWAGRLGGSAPIVRLGALGLLAAFVVENLTLTRQTLQERTMAIPLALGGVAWSRPFELASIDAIKWLSTTSATAAVVPDAAGINFASGRPSSVPFTEINPMALAMYGEQNVLQAFDRHPPDYVLIMEIDQSGLGASTFGRDYGRELSLWIASHYRYAGKFSGGSHPIELWKFDPAGGRHHHE
jgi:hypothetical protein